MSPTYQHAAAAAASNTLPSKLNRHPQLGVPKIHEFVFASESESEGEEIEDDELAEPELISPDDEGWWKHYDAPEELRIFNDDTPSKIVALVQSLDGCVEEHRKNTGGQPDEKREREHHHEHGPQSDGGGQNQEMRDAAGHLPTADVIIEIRSLREEQEWDLASAGPSTESMVQGSIVASDESPVATAYQSSVDEVAHHPVQSTPLSNPSSSSTVPAPQGIKHHARFLYLRRRFLTSSLPALARAPWVKALKMTWRKHRQEGDCSSCLEKHSSKALRTLNCKHSYCAPCLRMLVLTAVSDEQFFPPRCCSREVSPNTVKSVLSRGERSQFKKKEREYKIPWNCRVHCPRDGCSAWIPPEHLTLEVGEHRCPKCKYRMCSFCRGAAHAPGEDCAEDMALLAALATAEQQGWKRCYRCHALVERIQGCFHMTCRCKAQFCYSCAAPWKTCACSGYGEEADHYYQAQAQPQAAAPAAAPTPAPVPVLPRTRAQILQQHPDGPGRFITLYTLASQAGGRRDDQPQALRDPYAIWEAWYDEAEQQRREISQRIEANRIRARDHERQERLAARARANETARRERHARLEQALAELHSLQKERMLARHQHERALQEDPGVFPMDGDDDGDDDQELKVHLKEAHGNSQSKDLREKRQTLDRDNHYQWHALQGRSHRQQDRPGPREEGKKKLRPSEQKMAEKKPGRQEPTGPAEDYTRESEHLSAAIRAEWQEFMMGLRRRECQEGSERRKAEKMWFEAVAQARVHRLAAEMAEVVEVVDATV